MGAAFGALLLVAASLLLWFNEGDAVKGQQKILEAQKALAAPGDEGRGLTHMMGMLAGSGELRDDAFGLTAKRSIKLQRTVEVFLWKEHTDTTNKKVPDGRGGQITETTKTHRYTSGWESAGIDSHRFKHEAGHRNPSWSEALSSAGAETGLAFGAASWQQPHVSLGGLDLSSKLLEQAVRWQSIAPTTADAAHALSASQAKLSGAYVYSGAACAPPREPAIGCARVAWKHAPLEEVSVIARKVSAEASGRERGQLVPWASTAGIGYEVAMLEFGERDADAMLESAASAQSVMTWLKRGGGILLTWAGWAMLFGPAQYLASWIPLLSGLVGCVLSLIAFGAALAHSLTIIAIAWIAYRPILAVTLLIGAALSAVGGISALRGSSRAKGASSSSSRTGNYRPAD